MRLLSIIRKSLKEQVRSFWMLVLTVSMAPFFICVYYLFIEAESPHYDVVIVNNDSGLKVEYGRVDYSDVMISIALRDSSGIPLTIHSVRSREAAEDQLKNNKADIAIIIPPGFSSQIGKKIIEKTGDPVEVEFIGDLTSIEYMFTAIWINELIIRFIFDQAGVERPVTVTETALGSSGNLNTFDIYVPGMLILSIIMLMFTASIALITEVENKTMVRLKFSQLTTFEYITGIGVVQVFVGIISVFLTLTVAVILGFTMSGSFFNLVFIAILTSISIVAFSFIVAAMTRTVNEILIVGNFPLFLFMFFTGAAFPIPGVELFTAGGYTFTLQGIMAPTHAVSALKKLMILNMGHADILPEILWIIILTGLYFVIGILAFNRRHMRIH